MDNTVMKKSFIFFLFAFVPVLLWADPVEIDGIFYNLIEKGKIAEVTKNPNKYTGSVEIPELVSYEGTDYSVTSIGESAFSNCTGLTSITIPGSVTSIGESAFSNCTGLTSITIPGSVTSIGESAFNSCTGLTSITIPNSVTSIYKFTFYGCSGLTSITIPNSVTSIGANTFSRCTGLTSITIPNSVTGIGDNAFQDCTGLTSIIIPNSVTTIGDYAFQDCTGLTSIIIPNSVTTIGVLAFNNCTGLTSITIPNNVTRIEYGAFSGCTGLTSITIPNSVTSIYKYAFYGCSGLTSITIPSSVREIGDHSFANCPDLNDVFCYAENVPSANYDAFKDSYVEYATLHVPANSINKYKETEPWKNFGNIVALEGTTTKKCETPTISYENGVLKMTCATEGVEYVTDIADADIKKHYDSEITLSATYNISVYATKAGYDNSDVVNATLCWIDAEPKTEGITNGIANVRSTAVLIQSNNKSLNISGVDSGVPIYVYDTSGKIVGSAIADSNTTQINTVLSKGSIAIVKMGAKSVKIIMK